MSEYASHILIFLVAVLVLQYAAAGWLDMHHGEPWPALVLPAFQTVRGDTETVKTLRPTIQVTFQTGTTDTLSVAEWLGDLPRSHHGAFMRTFFCPAALCTHRATERGATAEAACWTRGRLHQLFPGQSTANLTVRWEELTYNPPGTAPADVVLKDTFAVNPADCHAPAS